jgi:hypothetical protein
MRSDPFAPLVFTAMILVLPLAMPACSDEPAPVAGGFSVDTVGGVVHLANSGAGQWSPGMEWRLGEPVRIGADPMAEEAYAFGDVGGVTVAADGRIYVADGQAKEVRVFSPTGTFLFRFGRSGEGPGEFNAIDALARTPDGDIVARDPRLFRVTRFTSDGEYKSDFRIQRPFPQYGGGLGFAIDRAGTVHDRLSITLGIESDDSLAVIRYAPGGIVRDTLIVAVSPRRYVSVVKDGVPQMGMAVPFTAFASAAVGPDGTIARTRGVRYSFDLLDREGAIARTISRDVQPAAVTAAERDSTLTAMRESAREYSDGGQLEDFEVPATKAAITHLRADTEGNWWVGANYAANRLVAPGRFDVFDPDGHYLGRVDVPFRPIEIGDDYVAGVSIDELGVQAVVVAPLIKRQR